MTEPSRRLSGHPDPGRPLRQRDVVALVFGVLLTGVALGALWQLLISPLDWNLIKIVAPLGLVVVGVAGLALSRNKS